MRIAFREHLETFSRDVLELCGIVDEVMATATSALVRRSLQSAEEALSRDEEIEALAAECEARAVELLALENPVARDLRQVVSSIYIVDDLRRMGALSLHIANSARRRHPEPSVPEDLRPSFEELGALCHTMIGQIRELLAAPNPDDAAALQLDDDAVDDLQAALLTQLTRKDGGYSAREAVDVSLLVRYYERFADHCVAVADRLIYLTTGQTRAEYLANRSSEHGQG